MTRKIITWGMFIRNYLLENGPSYIFQVYRAYAEYLKEHGYRPISYKTMVTYFYVLKKLGLIKEVKREKIRNTGLAWDERIYYDIVKEKKDSKMWYNPWQHYNPASVIGGRYYQRKQEI